MRSATFEKAFFPHSREGLNPYSPTEAFWTPAGGLGEDRLRGKDDMEAAIGVIKFDGFVKSPVHPSIPQGERIIKSVTV